MTGIGYQGLSCDWIGYQGPLSNGKARTKGAKQDFIKKRKKRGRCNGMKETEQMRVKVY